MHNCKFLCVMVMILANVVNTQTDRQTDRELLTGYAISSASRAKMLKIISNNNYFLLCFNENVQKFNSQK